uniref:Potassium channel toxin n=1 Tax=Didymocentrus krausi TaxID=1546215 RepID=A0A3S8V503_9SCOR|nr:potassium channel toxin [Didymocentrus krausi]
MNKNLLAAFLLIMLISTLADGKNSVVKKVKTVAKKVYNKMKNLVAQSEYGCPMVSNFCEDVCKRKGKDGQCDFLECICS